MMEAELTMDEEKGKEKRPMGVGGKSSYKDVGRGRCGQWEASRASRSTAAWAGDDHGSWATRTDWDQKSGGGQ